MRLETKQLTQCCLCGGILYKARWLVTDKQEVGVVVLKKRNTIVTFPGKYLLL